LKTIKLEIAKNIKDSFGYTTEALKKIHANDQHGYTPKEVERLLKIEKDFGSIMKPIKTQIEEAIFTIGNRFKVFAETLKLISAPTLNTLYRVSEFGWYLSPTVFRDYSLFQLADMIQQNDLSKLENSIVADSSELINLTINKAIRTFPDRKKILTEIQDCFDNEYFSAVVNLSYSQADGICNKIWGFSFFDKTEKPDFTLKAHYEFNKYSDGLATMFSKQLSIKENEVTMHSKSFEEQFPDRVSTSFNRHLIIHGHSINYGNKINAIRAILIIDFLMYFKEEKEKNKL
jgi:hypothetical protein